MNRWFVIFAAAVVLAGCTKREELDFAGRVVATQECTAAFPQLSYGYLVKAGDTARNVIVMYEPTCIIRISDHIHGTFYLDDKYSKVNCSWQWDGVELHEGVFLETIIDK